MNPKEVEYAGQLIRLASVLSNDIVIRFTTFDEAVDALIDAFTRKGNTKIDDEKKFVAFVNRYLPEKFQSEPIYIEAIYKAAQREYVRRTESKGN